MTDPLEPSAVKDSQRVADRPRFRPSQIVGFVGFVLFGLLGLTSGRGGVIMFVGLYVLGTGVYALARRRSWLGSTSRMAAAGLLAGGLVVTMIGGAVAGPPAANPAASSLARASATPSAPATASATPTLPTAPAPTPTPTEPSLAEQAAQLPAPELAPEVDLASVGATAKPQSALATALLLTVKGRAPMTGYARAQFGQAWQDTDHNGCDQRNDVLTRDLTALTFKAGSCVVISGTLADPYSGKAISFLRGQKTSSAVQIDHVVALSDAWQKGAQQWDSAMREKFANDFVNLLAVDGPLNAQKGDGDAATWLPPNKAFRCEYVARQVGVKFAYGVWVTQAEQNAMVSLLSGCPNQPLPVGVTPPAGPAPAPAPAPAPPLAPAPAPAPAPAQGVHSGAFCTPFGARGEASTGAPMQCRPSATDSRNRWRAA